MNTLTNKEAIQSDMKARNISRLERLFVKSDKALENDDIRGYYMANVEGKYFFEQITNSVMRQLVADGYEMNVHEREDYKQHCNAEMWEILTNWKPFKRKDGTIFNSPAELDKKFLYGIVKNRTYHRIRAYIKKGSSVNRDIQLDTLALDSEEGSLLNQIAVKCDRLNVMENMDLLLSVLTKGEYNLLSRVLKKESRQGERKKDIEQLTYKIKHVQEVQALTDDELASVMYYVPKVEYNKRKQLAKILLKLQ